MQELEELHGYFFSDNGSINEYGREMKDEVVSEHHVHEYITDIICGSIIKEKHLVPFPCQYYKNYIVYNSKH